MNPEPPTTQRKARRITTGERIGLFPEIVEVEPVVRRGAAIMLEPLHIGGQGLLRGMAAPIRRRIRPIGQALEMDVVAPAAAIEGTHQDNGAPKHGGNLERAERKRRRLAEEGCPYLAFVAEAAVGQHADKVAALQRRLDLEHRIGAAQGDDLDVMPGIDRIERRIDLARVLFIHDENDAQARLAGAERAQDLETAEMCAEQQTPLAARDQLIGEFLAFNAEIEDARLVIEQENPVQRAGGEGVVMAE